MYIVSDDAFGGDKVGSTRVDIRRPRPQWISILTLMTPYSSAWTRFLGNGIRAMAETGLIPCGEAPQASVPWLTISVCVVQRCLIEPFARSNMFHKLTTLTGKANVRQLPIHAIHFQQRSSYPRPLWYGFCNIEAW